MLMQLLNKITHTYVVLRTTLEFEIKIINFCQMFKGPCILDSRLEEITFKTKQFRIKEVIATP